MQKSIASVQGKVLCFKF